MLQSYMISSMACRIIALHKQCNQLLLLHTGNSILKFKLRLYVFVSSNTTNWIVALKEAIHYTGKQTALQAYKVAYNPRNVRHLKLDTMWQKWHNG